MVLQFCILERIKDGVVVFQSSRIWTVPEAEQYVKTAATQGETYHIVYCDLDVPPNKGKPWTNRLSFSLRESASSLR